MIVTTDAIVLHIRKHGETSKLVTLLTRDHGRLTVIAKGARSGKSPFGGALEAFSVSRVTFYHKPGGGLYLTSKAEIVQSNLRLTSDLARLQAASALAELLIRATQEEERNEELFDLGKQLLLALGRAAPETARALMIWFYLTFLGGLGFRLQLAPEAAERQQGQLFRQSYLRLENGEISEIYAMTEEALRGRHLPGSPITEAGREALQNLQDASLEEAESAALPEVLFDELERLLQSYFIHHLAGFSGRSFRSGKVFGSLSHHEASRGSDRFRGGA